MQQSTAFSFRVKHFGTLSTELFTGFSTHRRRRRIYAFSPRFFVENFSTQDQRRPKWLLFGPQSAPVPGRTSAQSGDRKRHGNTLGTSLGRAPGQASEEGPTCSNRVRTPRAPPTDLTYHCRIEVFRRQCHRQCPPTTTLLNDPSDPPAS